MKIENEEYRGYVPHLMHGIIEWWRTTRSKSVSVTTSGKEVRSGSHIDRVVTTATTIEEARKQLDRRLTPSPKSGQGRDPDQLSIL